jgi:hypothetical protein
LAQFVAPWRIRLPLAADSSGRFVRRRCLPSWTSPTQTGMNGHPLLTRDSEKLAPIRENAESGSPVRWTCVHRLSDRARFTRSSVRELERLAGATDARAGSDWSGNRRDEP